MSVRIGVIALARPTFDVPFAEAMAASAFKALDGAGVVTVGPRSLLFDAASAKAAFAELSAAGVDRLLLLQVTFTDATMTVELADATPAPLAIWAFPEPRAGGRLRLNSFCGLNLALHALGRAGRRATYLYATPEAVDRGALDDLLTGTPRAAAEHAIQPPAGEAAQHGSRCARALNGTHIGLIGEHPAGFDTCRFDDEAISRLAGVEVQRVKLDDIFARAKSMTADRIDKARGRVATLAGIDAVDQQQLDKSMRVYEALEDTVREKGCVALAVRCWPEMFTDYGCAACGPMGLLNGRSLPAACEADVYGALTQKLLQDIAQQPAWLVDIVDMDKRTDTSVFWHCGSAPATMCDPAFAPEAQIHSNRKMPLLAQFPLKPGRVTIARITQARNVPRLVVATGEMLRAPLSFTGTSGVVRFDGGTERAMRGLLDHALEHHVAVAYGDHADAVAGAGLALGLPVIALAG